MNKISVPSPVFCGDESETLQSVYTLECQQRDGICFRYNKIRSFDTLERQTVGVNKYAGTFPIDGFFQ